MQPREILALVVLAVAVWIVVRVVRKGARGHLDFARGLVRDEQLKRTGERARATVLSVRETSSASFGLAVDFQVEALDGTEKFSGQKVLRTMESKPTLGSVWPAWYDAADTTQFAVEVTDALSLDQIPLYREFGIAHPLDKH